MKYFISAGEASGDLHASQLITALRKADPEADFSFIGGDKMAAAAGSKPMVHISEMAFMGFGEVLRNLRHILGRLSQAKEHVDSWHPDAVVLVDYPSFNLKLAKHAAKKGIKVFWYISPKVWVWKEHRVKTMKKVIDRLYCILPFETAYFSRRHAWDVEYVGNPSAEEILNRDTVADKDTLARRLSLPSGKPLLALLPGSRRKEIEVNLPIMIEAARRFPQYQPVIATVSQIEPKLYAKYNDSLPMVADRTFNLLEVADAAIVTSGTATLETALFRVPQVMVYRHSGSKTFYRLFRRLLKVDYFSLPNLINNKPVIDELVMYFCTPEAVEESLRRILPGTEGRKEQLAEYDRLIATLGASAPSLKVAEDIVKRLHE